MWDMSMALYAFGFKAGPDHIYSPSLLFLLHAPCEMHRRILHFLNLLKKLHLRKVLSSPTMCWHTSKWAAFVEADCYKNQFFSQGNVSWMTVFVSHGERRKRCWKYSSHESILVSVRCNTKTCRRIRVPFGLLLTIFRLAICKCHIWWIKAIVIPSTNHQIYLSILKLMHSFAELLLIMQTVPSKSTWVLLYS